MSPVESVGARGDDAPLTDAPSAEQLDDARERELRARLSDARHPLSGAEWQAIQRELVTIRHGREARAYAATKHAGGDAPLVPSGGVGLATLLAVRSGVLLKELPEAPAPLASARPELAPLDPVATEDAARAWAKSPEVQMAIKARLYRDLAALGDTRGCVAGDTVESLVDRRNDLVAARRAQGQAQADAMKSMGVDGLVFKDAEAYALYEHSQRMAASGFVAAIAVARGLSVEQIRAAEAQGNMLEGMAVGAVGIAPGAASPAFDTTTPPAVTYVLPAGSRPTAPTVAAPPPAPPAPPKGVGGTARVSPPEPKPVAPTAPMATVDYGHLRKRSPDAAARRAVNQTNGPKLDPVYGFAVDRYDADHIVPLKEILRMPGFEALSPEGQLQVVNLRDKFMGLSHASNASKGARSWSEWKGHSTLGPVPPEVRAEMLKEEARARVALQAAIDARKPR